MLARARVRLVIFTLTLALAGVGPARGDNCVDRQVEPARAGRLCRDVGSSMGRLEVWRAPGFLDVRIGTMRLALYGNDAARRATGFELASWEAIGDDGDGLEAPRDLGDRAAAHLLTLRREIDRDGWGAYVAGELVTRWFGHTRLATPRLGLRLGRFDRSAVIVEAALAGAYLVGGAGDHRALTADVDVTGRATLAVARRLRLEARGRYRDVGAADGWALRDQTLAIGVELEASPPRPRAARDRRPDTWRVMTLFVGLAVRRALTDVDPAAPSPIAAALATTPTTASAPTAPWQVLAWVDLDFAINSQRTIW